ncbi:TolC family protein [Candidatus Sodalis endolongispinus]|uniref:TolC family protein n=1 Tax=Candidatus Sodalis endolongispinus TaxID=2812662 RepID=A0ABS5Y909_9GAMM|nr:TolC family protein [Candidatus Sodalis endolongispinus]MBT9431144.1 TolC family protein [Candidatus Sodalis endolongispinus]
MAWRMILSALTGGAFSQPAPGSVSGNGACDRRSPRALALFIAGCGGHPVGPDYRPPATALISRAGSLPLHNTDAGAPMTAADALASARPLPPYWWRLYQDPQLDALVRQALARNTDLRLAMANLERQQALLKEAASAQNPSLSANAEPYYGHPSGLSVLEPGYVPDNAWRYDGGLSLSYQLDLFGQIQRALEAASADSEAAQAALDLVKINVAANTARAYADLCATGLQLMTTRHSIELQQRSVDLTRRLLQAGRTGELDTVRSRATATAQGHVAAAGSAASE